MSSMRPAIEGEIRPTITTPPSNRGRFSDPLTYFRLTLAAGAGLGLVACTNKDINPATVTQEPAKAAASATAAPGFGGPEPIATYPANNPRAERLNPIIDKLNDPAKAKDVTNEERNLVSGARSADLTATVEAQKPISTPEKKPLYSKLFPGVDISNASIIPYTDSQGSIDLVAINLDAGVKIAAPLSTDFSTAEATAPFSGSWAGFSTGGRDGIIVIGNYTFLKQAPGGAAITEGEFFAVSTETDHKNQGGKTVVVQIANFDPTTGKFFTPKEEVEKYFPGIYSKAAVKAINYDGPINAVITHHYSGGPNDSR